MSVKVRRQTAFIPYQIYYKVRMVVVVCHSLDRLFLCVAQEEDELLIAQQEEIGSTFLQSNSTKCGDVNVYMYAKELHVA